MSFLKSFENRDFSIDVSTQKLAVKAEEIKDICSDILRDIGEVENCVNSLSYFWSADSSELLVKLFEQESEEYKDIALLMDMRISQLNRIISLYEDVEETNINEIGMLPDEIIS